MSNHFLTYGHILVDKQADNPINIDTPMWCVRAVVRAIARLEAKSPSYKWFVRVPSSSNQADAPSRGDLDELKKCGAVRNKIDWGVVCATVSRDLW